MQPNTPEGFRHGYRCGRVAPYPLLQTILGGQNMRTISLIVVSLVCLTLFVALIPWTRRLTRQGGGEPATIEILLVGGLHPNEACAQVMARDVYKRLTERGVRVALYDVPYRYTLLALVDDPTTAVTDYSIPKGVRRLDVDLDGLDGLLKRRYPEALVFEFHNSEDTTPMFGIDPSKSVHDYEVGMIGPEFKRPYEIGTWRNVGRDGRPDKFLIEVPALLCSRGTVRRGAASPQPFANASGGIRSRTAMVASIL